MSSVKELVGSAHLYYLANMKHLKSSLKELRELFERSITIRDICEPLSSFDIDSSTDIAKHFMNIKDYDVIGIRKDGLVCGYARKSGLSDGKLGDYLIPFGENEVFPETTSLVKAMQSFHSLDRIFVIIIGEVGGIVTHGDLQKAPIRMWLFGLISLIEMQLLRIIREFYPKEEWEKLLTTNRIKYATKIYDDRQKRNTAIDLADCLQFCDKRDIVLNNNVILEKLGGNFKSLNDFLNNLEDLRDNLAHAQDIITGYWPGIIGLAKEAEDFLDKCEGI